MWSHEPTCDIELKELLELYLDIGNMTIEKNSKYGFRFILNPTSEYIVKIMRKLLESKLIPFKGLTIWWSKLIPLKVSGFIWRALLGRIPVADTLATRRIIIPNNLCPLCNKETKTVDHILVTCEYSREVQYWILKWCGIEKEWVRKCEGIHRLRSYLGKLSNEEVNIKHGVSLPHLEFMAI
ncbi:unnamed protein product [Lactuca saligna]|uniref:Reverse transcriptase zinc-binding domain-containing protein n=1 Tax=Lactuca saligna TaxID=75948 RepID=A0AA36E7D4_LACSI|nr:unnamed protein product [Lactuca saligna]